MKDQGIKYGIIAGVGSMLYMLLFYFFDRKLMLSHWINWSGLIIYIVAMFGAIFSTKQQNGGFITAQEGMKAAFTTFLLANAIFYLFYWLLFNVVDPDLSLLQKTVSLDLLEETRTWYPEDRYLEMKESMESSDFKVTLGGSIFAYAKGAIGGFLLSFFMGRLIRNK